MHENLFNLLLVLVSAAGITSPLPQTQRNVAISLFLQLLYQQDLTLRKHGEQVPSAEEDNGQVPDPEL